MSTGPKAPTRSKKTFDGTRLGARPRGDSMFRHIEGEGVFEVAVGPIHAGIIEVGPFSILGGW